MMRHLLPLILLAGCATSAPITRIVTLTPEIPAPLLTCAPPPIIPDPTSQAVVADYIVSLWQAGQDCRQHLQAVRTALAK